MSETAAGLFARIRQRRPVRWVLACVAVTFMPVQVLDVLAPRSAGPGRLEHILCRKDAAGGHACQ